MEEPASIPAIRFRSAVRFVRTIEAAEDIVLGRPAHVIAHEKIKQAIPIIIKPQRGSAEALTPEEAARTRGINESSFAGVAKKPALPHAFRTSRHRGRRFASRP